LLVFFKLPGNIYHTNSYQFEGFESQDIPDELLEAEGLPSSQREVHPYTATSIIEYCTWWFRDWKVTLTNVDHLWDQRITWAPYPWFSFAVCYYKVLTGIILEMRYSEQRDEAIAQLFNNIEQICTFAHQKSFCCVILYIGFERDPRCPEVAQENYTLIVTITSWWM
jgi:hypothetical protein